MAIDRRQALSLLALSLLGCQSPSEPVESLVYAHEIRVTVQSVDGASVLRSAELFVDGVPLTSQSTTESGAEVVVFGATSFLTQGTHSATLRVRAQDASPGHYKLTSIKISRFTFENGRMVYPFTESIRALNVTAIVETGQSIAFDFANNPVS